MTRETILLLLILVGCCYPFAASSTETDATQKTVEQPIHQSIDTRQATQKERDRWHLEKEKLVARFEQLQEEQKQIQYQQEKLQEKVTTARRRLSTKKKQLSDIQQITSQIQPFLNDLAHQLKRYIEDDLPFLSHERQIRIQKLETLMNDPEVDISEKYRKVMEALLVEAEYGFTIETYQQTISIDNRPLLADILRLGRIGLYYQSLDRQRAGFYNVAAQAWQSLPASDNVSIQTAIDIAAKRQPVELLSLPLGRLVVQ